MIAAFRPKAKIDNGQVILGDKSYPLAEIVSAELAQKQFKLTVPITSFWLLGLIGLTLAAITDDKTSALVLSLIGFSGVTLIAVKGLYIVRLNTKSSIVDAYSSDNKKQIKWMVDTINAAIAGSHAANQILS